jgi:hypothetical protein
MMKEKGILAQGIGSLAKGKFRPDSDIDFLLTSSPRKYKYAIETKVGDILGRGGGHPNISSAVVPPAERISFKIWQWDLASFEGSPDSKVYI